MGKLKLFFILAVLSGCTSALKTNVPIEKLKENEEYEKMVDIKPIQTLPQLESVKEPGPKPLVKKTTIAPKKTPLVIPPKIAKHLPDLEDSEGFNGRRPLIDPFRVGERVVLDLNYLNMNAGQLVLETLPFVEVNGKKSYQFSVRVKSSDMFSYVYKLDNKAETFVDFETLLPYSHSVHINESKQIVESKSFYDWKTLKGNYWERKVTKKGETNKRQSWTLSPYSQNLISTMFYLRNFQLKVGKVIQYRVADSGKDAMVRIKVLKEEKIKTKAGEFNTNMIKVEYKTDGTFEQSGDVYFWITNDDRKFVVKLKSKIKIGSIHGEISELIL